MRERTALPIIMINQLITFSTALFFFLFPLFHLTITSESYEYNKLALLILFTTFFILLFSIKIIRERKITFIGGTFTTLFFFLTCIVVISTIFQTPNIVVALTTPLSTTTIIFGFILLLVLVQISSVINLENLFNILIIDSLLLSLYVLGVSTGILPQNNFTPAGSLLATTTFLSIIAIFLLAKIIDYFRENTKNNKTLFILYFLSLLLIGGTTIFLTIHLFTDQKPMFLPLGFGWIILLEILKNLKTMFLGIGLSNFLTAFTLGKPLLINQTSVWNITFTSSSSFFLNLATEAGIIAGIIYIWILLKSLKLLKSLTTHNYSPFIFTLIFALIIFLIFPGNMSSFILIILLLALVSEKKTAFTVDLTQLKKSSYFLLLPSVLFAILVGFFGGRAYFAEIIYKQSLDALLNGRGGETYNLQIQALTLNPYLDRYHVVFSQTNLALANALAAQKTLSDEDKQRIPHLVQQSIDQARTAVTLYRTNVVNWDNLARIYASLTTYAKDADAWAETSYQQKIQLDPLNPNTRLSLGGFYLQMQKWDMAEDLFRQAISLKPDFANAHFNLAVSLRQQKKFTEAYKELQSSMALVSPNSTDSAKIKEELDFLPPEAVSESASPASSNLPPQKLEELGKPSISLPQPPITP